MPRPGKFVDQSIAFCKAFCKLLLSHGIIKSDLARGLSSFDSSVIFEGSEQHYTVSIEKLTAHFVGCGWISSGDKVKAISQYRSFVAKLRDGPIPPYEDWLHFLSSHYEIQCRPELYQLYKYSCLCLPPLIEMPTPFVVPLAGLEYGVETFQSCLQSLQTSYQTIPDISSLYRDPKSISRAFRLLGRGTDLLTDKKFSVWNFLKGSGAKRSTLLGKLESGYRKAVLRIEKPPPTSNSTTPSVSRRSSTNSTPSPYPTLSRVSLEFPRCAEVSAESISEKAKNKSGKGKKTY